MSKTPLSLAAALSFALFAPFSWAAEQAPEVPEANSITAPQSEIPVITKEGSKLPQVRRDILLEGWRIRVDERLFEPEHDTLRKEALRFLENKLADIRVVVPAARVEKLQMVQIVLDLDHGDLGPMQYHPSAAWLVANGYARDLEKCVHLPRAADLATSRNIREQPWVILHELSHAYHDQVLGFDEERVRAVFKQYKGNGRGAQSLLYSGRRERHYALTNHKEFFAEMTESYFGTNDFYPFNRAELLESEPEIHALMKEIWEDPQEAKSASN